MVDSTMTDTGGSLVQRMIRAARLDSGVYEEVEADRSATGQAATVVGIVVTAGAIGQAIAFFLNTNAAQTGAAGPVGVVVGIVVGIIGALLGWVVWAYVTQFVGTRFFGGTATPGELLRTLGFAQSPGVLNILSFIPGIGAIITFATAIWSLVAGIIAVRQALDIDTGKAILTAVIGWLFFVVLAFVLVLIAGLFLAGTGALGS